jgi:hypothetical protein
MKLPCSGCGKSLLLKDTFDQGQDHRTGKSYRTCRRCFPHSGGSGESGARPQAARARADGVTLLRFAIRLAGLLGLVESLLKTRWPAFLRTRVPVCSGWLSTINQGAC